jgi:hypothetical protein
MESDSLWRRCKPREIMEREKRKWLPTIINLREIIEREKRKWESELKNVTFRYVQNVDIITASKIILEL